ncbi:efflux RND transporter permease subunit [Paraferrimonas sp. SM1919]|uniref:efflux RND transporter permease subunit n=1 Tax=Paraferrimonas sp. SM1919 TaxID=2662263 RepID=UPI001F090E22|nr:multidrug efflux RND transporter permease subunit [Paraferrimonas sp. SM1919]
MVEFFIRRPKFAIVLSIIMTIIGLIALLQAPVEQYPAVAPPEIEVSTEFTGANAEVLRDTVAKEIEKEVNGVEGMIYMKSKSSNDGNYILTVTFEVGYNADKAQILVQNRVNRAMAKLPDEVKRSGVKVEKTATNIMLAIMVSSPDLTRDGLFLNNYANMNIKDEIARIPGVSKVRNIGDMAYAMRIWLDPEKMTGLGITPEDVSAAIGEQNVIRPAGMVGAAPYGDGNPQFQMVVRTEGRLKRAEQFNDIVIKADTDGKLVRISDVGKAELGSQQYLVKAMMNKSDAALLAIYQSPGANALDISAGIEKKMAELEARFPAGVAYDIPYNQTEFVKVSIAEVIETLIIAIILVTIVSYVFLQDWRTTIIPVIAIPVSVIATFAVMQWMGMSMNMLTLLGLVLSIGVVVDAAIIVVENVERIMHEEHLDPMAATLKAMKEVTAPILASALVLFAVFGPVTMMPGLTGQLYQQFGITISVSVALSTINALTLTPALAAILMRPGGPKPGKFLQGFNRVLDKATIGLGNTVSLMVKRLTVTLLLFGAMIAAIVFMAGKMPQGFLPDEDSGSFFVNIELPMAASLNRTQEITDEAIDMVLAQDGVSSVVSAPGFSLLGNAAASNSAMMIVNLEHWSDRKDAELGMKAIMAKTQAQLSTIQEADIITFFAPAIPALGMNNGFEMRLEDTQGRSAKQLSQVADALMEKAMADPAIDLTYTMFRSSVPQLEVQLDRDKIKASNVSIETIYTSLQTYLGGMYVNDFSEFGRNFKVFLQSSPDSRVDASDITKIHVRANDGRMVPLSSLVEVKNVLGPEGVELFNLYNSLMINGVAAEGYSSGQAVAAMAKIADETLPAGYKYDWSGLTYQEQKAGNAAPLMFGMAMLFTFLFLVAQYESWMTPLAIILCVPTAVFGAFLHTWLMNGDINVYTQVGLVLMVGMASRNAILIVEFAKELRENKGMGIVEAGVAAAKLRFRAVLMTAFSFILGVVPLVIATGAGSGARQAIGFSTFGGMTAATVLGCLIVPVLFVIFQRMREKANPAITEMAESNAK